MASSLDELLKSIRDEAKKESALVAMDGASDKDDQLVDEEIDERILRLLGIEDVFDIDYATYKTLLKERMMAARMSGSEIPTEEAEVITNEFKRVKGKEGRFKVKKKKISVGDIRKSSPLKGLGSVKESPQKLLAPAEEVGPVESIIKSLSNIVEILKERNSLIKKQQERNRKNLQNKERGNAEAKAEAGAMNKMLEGAKKVIEPVQSLLGRIFETFMKLVFGRFLIKFVDWFADPDNQGKINAIGSFLRDHWPKLLAAYLLFGNSLGRFVVRITAMLVRGAATLLTKVLPQLFKFIAANPKLALLAGAAGLFAAGGIVPALFPQTVEDDADKQANEAAKEKGNEQAAADIRKQNENRGVLGSISDFFTGAGQEREEQAQRLETGEEKRYGFFGELAGGGRVSGPSGTDVIPARLTDGEFVMSKGAVDAFGTDFMEGINAAGGGNNRPKKSSGTIYAAGGGQIGSRRRGSGYGSPKDGYSGGHRAGISEVVDQTINLGVSAQRTVESRLSDLIEQGNQLIPRLEQGLVGLGMAAEQLAVQSQRTLENAAIQGYRQSEQFARSILDAGQQVTNDVINYYQSGEMERQLVAGGQQVVETAQQTGKNIKKVGLDITAGTFDTLSNLTGSKMYQDYAAGNATAMDERIKMADSIVDALPEGSPLQDIMDKGLIPIPSGDATTMRNLTFVKALLGPLGQPFKIMSNDEVDKMRQLTIQKTLDKSGLIMGEDGEVKMNWNQEDINKGRAGGGAYTDDLGPGGKAFNSILGRFHASTRDGGNVLYTDDKYNFNKSTSEYLKKAKEQLLGGAFGEAAYFGAAALGKFAEDIGWLNQRALGSRIEIGEIDRNKVDSPTSSDSMSSKMSPTANLTADQIKNNQAYAASKGKYYSSTTGKTYASYADALKDPAVASAAGAPKYNPLDPKNMTPTQRSSMPAPPSPPVQRTPEQIFNEVVLGQSAESQKAPANNLPNFSASSGSTDTSRTQKLFGIF